MDRDSLPFPYHPDSVVLLYETAEDLFWLHYGILSLPSNYQLPASLKNKYKKMNHPANIKSVLGHWAEDILPEGGAKRFDVTTYIAFLTTPPQPGTAASLVPGLSDTVGPATKYPYSCQRWVQVETGLIAGSVWYIVTPSNLVDGDSDWVVAVRDPLTVNQILRERFSSSTDQLVSLLVQKGVAFKTLCPYPRPYDLMWPAPDMPMFTDKVALGMGVRIDPEKSFTVSDYYRYMRTRDEVLRGCDGRAALLAGGILWRLAMDGMGSDAASDGPGQYPTKKNYFEFNGRPYVDDVLSQHQEDVICGVYQIVPSKI